MTAVAISVSAAVLEAAGAVLMAPQRWPDPASGLGHRIFLRAGAVEPDFMLQPLRGTSAMSLRRTPELAAFGYLIDRADKDTAALWRDAVEFLRGREIYPADRQSFIFNPVEILGIALGMTSPTVAVEQREWFVSTVLRGFNQNQFRSPLSRLAAHAALACVDASKAQAITPTVLAVSTMPISDLVMASAVHLGFGYPTIGLGDEIEKAIMEHVLRRSVSIGDAAEAAALFVVVQRTIDRIALGENQASAEERIITLCRRFPLFVERLQNRHRRRASFEVADEYDVQDFLHAILKLHFDDIRPEEYTPSHAGGASRVDFFLPKERLVVEAKMTRASLGQKEVANELIIDAARYAKMPTVDLLICLVYDPEKRCSNPQAVESDVEASAGRLKVRAVVCPQFRS